MRLGRRLISCLKQFHVHGYIDCYYYKLPLRQIASLRASNIKQTKTLKTVLLAAVPDGILTKIANFHVRLFEK